jgi:hypothetical protein
MTKLEKLYSIIENSRDVGVKLPDTRGPPCDTMCRHRRSHAGGDKEKRAAPPTEGCCSLDYIS